MIGFEQFFWLDNPLLAQVNIGLNPITLLGFVLPAAGVALYLLRSFRPELARDHDIFFAAVALLCGFILIFQGWRLDPILAFGQFMLTGSAIFFAVESIRLREVATKQAKRNTPIVDSDRPVSDYYKANMDDEPEDYFEPYEERPRQLRGTRDTRSRDDDYEYGGELPPRSARSPRSTSRPSNRPDRPAPSSDRPPRKPRPRPDSRPVESADFQDVDDYTEPRPRSRRPNSDRPSRPPRPSSDSAASEPRRRPRPPVEDRGPEPRNTAIDTEPEDASYVDYRPVEPDEEIDNSANFD